MKFQLRHSLSNFENYILAFLEINDPNRYLNSYPPLLTLKWFSNFGSNVQSLWIQPQFLVYYWLAIHFTTLFSLLSCKKVLVVLLLHVSCNNHVRWVCWNDISLLFKLSSNPSDHFQADGYFLYTRMRLNWDYFPWIHPTWHHLRVGAMDCWEIKHCWCTQHVEIGVKQRD